jgi:succinoglycan biosynthesis protein ExoM
LYSARSAVAQVAATTSIPVRYVQSGAKNVALARNACLDAARGEWIAFIDDDEIAKPDWLVSLLAARDRYRADVVKGAVNAVYPAETPRWIKQADPYTRDYGPTGQTPTKLATGNVLFHRSLVEAPVRRFDPGFGRSGGEDTEFFRRVQRAGVNIVASREAVVDEVVPIERVTRGYLSGRARRLGQVEVKKAHLGFDDESFKLKVTFAILAVLVLSIHPLLWPLGARVWYKTFAKFWYSIGIIEGAALARSDEMSG